VELGGPLFCNLRLRRRWAACFYEAILSKRRKLKLRHPMSQLKPKQYDGGCLCGAIRFRAAGKPGKPHTCSCENCRKHSGAYTLSWVEFPADMVEWIGPGGKPSTWRSSSYSSRAFCSTCGTTIGAIDDDPVVALATGTFDKPHLKEFAPTYHSYISRRPRWWHVKSDHELDDQA
jgi:hypothetical protein